MWRDDRVITANGSGLRLVSYYVPGSSHRSPPDSRSRSASPDGLIPTTRASGKKRVACHDLVLDFKSPIQGGMPERQKTHKELGRKIALFPRI
jgi:hypothetical protein